MDNQYYKAMETTNGRTISIGDDLWREKKKLRAIIGEKKGLAPELGPDSSGAFVITLLHFYKDSSKSSQRSSKKQNQMRSDAIEVYEVNKNSPSAGKLYCIISDDWFDNEDYATAVEIQMKEKVRQAVEDDADQQPLMFIEGEHLEARYKNPERNFETCTETWLIISSRLSRHGREKTSGWCCFR